MSGKKNDQGKIDLAMMPKVAMEAAGKAFMVGEAKYGRGNYTAGLTASRLVAAALRHLLAWNEGEENDPVDGQPHLGSLIACAAMLLHTQELGTLDDNRTKPPQKPAERAVGPSLSLDRSGLGVLHPGESYRDEAGDDYQCGFDSCASYSRD